MWHAPVHLDTTDKDNPNIIIRYTAKTPTDKVEEDIFELKDGQLQHKGTGVTKKKP
jgi:hypothetical protein